MIISAVNNDMDLILMTRAICDSMRYARFMHFSKISNPIARRNAALQLWQIAENVESQVVIW